MLWLQSKSVAIDGFGAAIVTCFMQQIAKIDPIIDLLRRQADGLLQRLFGSIHLLHALQQQPSIIPGTGMIGLLTNHLLIALQGLWQAIVLFEEIGQVIPGFRVLRLAGQKLPVELFRILLLLLLL